METTPNRPLTHLPPKLGWHLALERAPLFLSILLLFFIPTLTQNENQDPLYAKQALTQILVYLMLCAWVLRGIVLGRVAWVQTNAFWFLLALLGWILLTIAFSPTPTYGWRAFTDWAVFPLWYFLLTQTCVEVWRAENLLVVFMAAGLGASGWAVGQALGLAEKMPGSTTNSFWGVTAGFGKAEHLAGYLLMVWPMALALFVRAQRALTRLLWSGLLVLSLIAIFVTGSKFGWLGLVLGALVYGFSYFARGKILRPFLSVLGIAAITVALSLFFPPLHDRMEAWVNTQNGSDWVRTQVWKGSVEMIRNNPLMGAGFGCFKAAFPAYRPAGLMMRQNQEGYGVEHASNWMLEWTAETGIVGLGLLFLVGWSVLAQWWKLFSANAIPRSLGAGVFAAFSGVLVENLFGMNLYLPSTLVPLLLLAALPVALSQRFYRMEKFPIRYREVDLGEMKAYLFPLLLVVGLMAFQEIKTSFQRQLAGMDLKKAADSYRAGKWDEAMGKYEAALLLDPGNLEAKYSRGSLYFDRNKPGDAEKAMADWNAVGEVAPNYLVIHFKKYQALRELNRLDEAKVELKRAIRLDPMLIYLLDDFGKARDLIAGGEYSTAFVIYQNLFFDYPTCVPLLISYANLYAMTRDYSSAINLYRRILDLDPGNAKATEDLRKVWEIDQKEKKLKAGSTGMGL